MKIALFGGSFDPPHLAHVQVIQYLLDSGRYDEVWVIPSRQNPFKEKGLSFETRLKMCDLAFGGWGPRVQCRRDEEKLSGYTIDLIRALKDQNPQHQFTFVAGSDLRDQVKDWKDGGALIKMIDFEFLPRPPEQGSPFLPLSSTWVRAQLAQGEAPDKFLPEKVAEFVEREQIYPRI